MVTGASWKPYYDLHGSMPADGKPSLDISLHYCANITQSTGEDWTNTTLTLSTSNSHTLHSLAIPEVDSLRLFPSQRSKNPLGSTTPPAPNDTLRGRPHQEDEPMPPVSHAVVPRPMMLYRDVSQRSLSDIFRSAPSSPYSVSEEAFKDDNIVNNALRDSVAVDKNPPSLACRVEGRVSLPSDGAVHKVSLAVLGFSAALKYVCVPRKASAVFMEGQIQNTSEYELPGGPVCVFVDGSFVTKTSLGVRLSVVQSRYVHL